MGKLARTLRHQGNLPAYAAELLGAAAEGTLFVEIDDSPDVAGVTIAPVSLTVRDGAGNPVSFKVRLGLGVFRESGRFTPATGAGEPDGTITQTGGEAGVILSGSATAGVEIETDENGVWEGKMNLVGGAAPQDLFLGSLDALSGSPNLDHRTFDSVTYDP